MADYRANAFPEDDATRGRFPMADGLLDYFPNALAAVAEVSKIGNDKHNPGQPMHHARGKSMDHRNKIMRHLCDAGGKDAGGVRHSAYVAWRALALLQEELEEQEGAPMARAAKPAEPLAEGLRVGDRVRIIVDNNAAPGSFVARAWAKGQTAHIRALDEAGEYRYVLRHPTEPGAERCYSARELELVERGSS